MKFEEQINKVELLGNVAYTRHYPIGEKIGVQFSVATNMVYRNNKNDVSIETTFHNCVASESEKIPRKTLEVLDKGTPVHIFGRLRNINFTGSDGSEKTITEIRVYDLKIINSQPEP